MAKNFRGQYRSAKERNHDAYGKNLEVVVERMTTSLIKAISAMMSGINEGLKEASERMKNRDALEGEFHVISDKQLLIGVDNASVPRTIEDCSG